MRPVFFLLSKVLDLLVAPLTWAVVLVALAMVWVRNRPGRARLLLALAALVLLVFSIEPVSRRLYARLESGVEDTFHPDPPYDVVVVLGGMVDPAAIRRSGQLELNDSVDRISRAALLLKAGQARNVLISGGLFFDGQADRSEADWLAEWLRDMGVEPDRIAVEGRSRNTRENATESAAIIAARGWTRVLLVTSAWHAPRALGCFRAAGVQADLLGVDHRAGKGGALAWLPRASALAASTDALHELFGGVVYRAVGYAK
jgi:uncharacterized SAM-binding protein YcdF (DUF218 family)